MLHSVYLQLCSFAHIYKVVGGLQSPHQGCGLKVEMLDVSWIMFTFDKYVLICTEGVTERNSVFWSDCVMT